MLATWLLNVPISLSRRRMVARRGYFFAEMLQICRTAPDAASAVMGQDSFDFSAEEDGAVIDAENGILIFNIPASFYGKDCRHTYSIWQIGDDLKIGVLLSDGLDLAPVLDVHQEIQTLWGQTPPSLRNKAGSSMYEWSFTVPTLYDSWIEQERFVRGMKHCKMRILRILHDYALLAASSKPLASN